MLLVVLSLALVTDSMLIQRAGTRNWNKTKLSYCLDNVSGSLGYQDTCSEIARAFKVWTDHCLLEIYEVEDRSVADIRIKFVSRRHGDRFPFDGPGGVLGHAFYPPSGEVHFDDEEEFTKNSNRGRNLYYIAVHELGHVLGLNHSTYPGALMAAYYPEENVQNNLQLSADDVRGIRQLYGAGVGAVYSSKDGAAVQYEQQLLQEKRDRGCLNKIDAVLQDPGTKAWYFFAGPVYYTVKMTPNKKYAIEDPLPIKIGWDGLEGDIRAAFTNISISVGYFFKDTRYWKYDFELQQMFSGFPKKTRKVLPRSLTGVTSDGNLTYFFQESTWWKYSSASLGLENITLALDEQHVDAAFLLDVPGYFATTHGNSYSVYKTQGLESIPAYRHRPLLWDYGLPMCSTPRNHVVHDPRATEICKAFALLAGVTHDLRIPEECYEMRDVGPFNVKELEEV